MEKLDPANALRFEQGHRYMTATMLEGARCPRCGMHMLSLSDDGPTEKQNPDGSINSIDALECSYCHLVVRVKTRYEITSRSFSYITKKKKGRTA